MKELDFQKELVASTIRIGGLGWIITDKFRKGRPDILLKAPQRDILIAECKLVKYAYPPIKIPINTTALQRIELRKLQSCEVVAPILVCLLVDKRVPVCYTIWDVEAETIDTADYEDLQSVRGENKHWDIHRIISFANIGRSNYEYGRRAKD